MKLSGPSQTQSFGIQDETSEESPASRYLDASLLAITAQNKGYVGLMEELYNHRSADAEVDQLYWALLGTVREEDEDWRDWFARILRQSAPAE